MRDLRLGHISASDNIDIFKVIAKKLKTGTKVKNYITVSENKHTSGPS